MSTKNHWNKSSLDFKKTSSSRPIKVNMKEMTKNTKMKEVVKDILTNQEKLKEFDMKLLKNQQCLILDNLNKSNEYIFALFKLLKKKDKTHFIKRKDISKYFDKRKNYSNSQPKHNLNINIFYNNLDNNKVTSNEILFENNNLEESNKELIIDEIEIVKENEKPKETPLEDSNEEFNYSHKNDYLESDFSYTENHKKMEKDKFIHKKLKEKYNFYPIQENIKQEERKESIALSIPRKQSTMYRSLAVEGNSHRITEKFDMNNQTKSMIFSKTGVNFMVKSNKNISHSSLKKPPENNLPIINMKTINVFKHQMKNQEARKITENEKAKGILNRVFSLQA